MVGWLCAACVPALLRPCRAAQRWTASHPLIARDRQPARFERGWAGVWRLGDGACKQDQTALPRMDKPHRSPQQNSASSPPARAAWQGKCTHTINPKKCPTELRSAFLRRRRRRCHTPDHRLSVVCRLRIHARLRRGAWSIDVRLTHSCLQRGRWGLPWPIDIDWGGLSVPERAVRTFAFAFSSEGPCWDRRAAPLHKQVACTISIATPVRSIQQ